jgi:7-carboxy-7-deazaguanine synthase
MGKETKIMKDGFQLPLVEEFYSIQGEGYHTGKAAYFIRIGGCDVGCSWCDSRFAWDPELHPLVETREIVSNVVGSGADSVVVTGGEPLMWNLDFLTSELKRNRICTYLETSGAYPLSGKWDWICLSPKRNMPPENEICRIADELKVIIEQSRDLKWAEKYRNMVSDHCRLFLQPEWSRFESVIPVIVDYVRKNYKWRISLQVHKYMHIP